MNQTILLIDAHPVYAQKTISFLKGLTFQDIRLADTGAKGLDEVMLKRPDLVILSATLPDMESLEVCKEITAMTNFFTKIIVQIGLFMEDETIAQFKANGAHVILERKEKDLMPLQKAIEEFLLNKV